MKKRIITGLVLFPLLLVTLIWLPEVVTAVLMAALSAVGAYELLYKTGLVQHLRLVLYSMVAAFLVPLWSYWGMHYAWGLIGLLAFCAVLFGEMMLSHVKLRFEKVAPCFVAGLLIPYLLASTVRVHNMLYGRHLVMIILWVTFLPDTGAYFAGRFFGKHKLAPVISPKKTIEGAVGGVLAAMLGVVIYTMILQLAFDFEVNYIFALIYGLVGSLGAVFGDLCFSVIKRQSGIKDYSNLFPGHGGVLDRLDSMIIVGPLVEALLILIPMAVKA